MPDPLDRNTWKELHPDILFAHRAPVSYENWAGRMADALGVTGARMLFPIHVEDAFLQSVDPLQYAESINTECRRKNISGRALVLERGVWYGMSTTLSR